MDRWEHLSAIYLHEILWGASQTNLYAIQIEDKGPRAGHLAASAFLVGFCAFEGFLNFVGEKVAPEIWEREREFFGREKTGYYGLTGKVKYLFAEVFKEPLDEKNEPYRTFKKLKDDRDSMAHSKVLRSVEQSESGAPPFNHWPWWLDPAKVDEKLGFLKGFADEIHSKAKGKFPRDEYGELGPILYPLGEGSLGHSERSPIN